MSSASETIIHPADAGRDARLLATVAHVPVSEASQYQGGVAEALARIHAMVDQLAPMPEQVYTHIHREIMQARPAGLRLTPGTVGSYLWGCPESKTRNGCAPLCAGSIPTPRSGLAGSACDRPVLVGKPSGVGYLYTAIIPQGEHKMDQAILYLPADRRAGLWFPPADLERLRNYGLKAVDVRFYGAGGDVVSSLGPMDLNKLPQTPPQAGAGMADWLKRYWWLILLLVVLAALGGWAASRRSKPT